MKPIFDKLFCFSFILLIISGCSQEKQSQKDQSQPEQQAKNNIKEPFKTQLIQFISKASEVNASANIGTSKDDFHRVVSEASGRFDLLKAIWPEDFNPQSRVDFNEAIKGWSYVASGILYGRLGSQEPSYREFYVALENYEKSNPFDVKLIHYTHNNDDYLPMMHDRYIDEQYDNTPKILLIASKYFLRGEEPILKALKN